MSTYISASQPATSGEIMQAIGSVAYIQPVCLPVILSGPSRRAASTGAHAPHTANWRNIATLNAM